LIEHRVKDGERLIYLVRDGDLVSITRRTQLDKAQALFQQLVPKNSPSLADELINERRQNSNHE
jgi:hypothetical protein